MLQIWRLYVVLGTMYVNSFPLFLRLLFFTNLSFPLPLPLSSPPPSPPPLLPLSSPSGSLPSPPPPFVQVSLSELKEALQNLLLERSERASQLEDMKRVTEAAKRERVLAIDEKDKLLSK